LRFRHLDYDPENG